MGDFYGWGSHNPHLFYDGASASASYWNDRAKGRTVPHTKMAEMFEKAFPQLKE